MTTAAYIDLPTEASSWTTNSTAAVVQMQCQKGLCNPQLYKLKAKREKSS